MPDDPTILLLAAGRATRMRGADKMLEKVDGVPLLRLMAIRAAKAGATRVVLAEGQTDRHALLSDLDIDLVEVPAGAGMAASIVAGIAGLDGPVLITLADMPEITANDLYLLLGLSRQAPKAILRAATPDGTPGHPVLFPRHLLPKLAKLEGDQGARDILMAEAASVHLVPLADDRATVDLDTPEAWAAWRARHG